MKTLPTFGRYLKDRFGERVAKIPLGISGFTCPNIDGTVAKGGCTFCLNDSFSPNLARNAGKTFLNLDAKTNPILRRQLDEVHRQIVATRETFRRQGIRKYLVYFQSFTNTYAPLETLKALYEKALRYDGVVGLSIGTRSDSITPETLAYLRALSEQHEVWIEYGIQSVFDRTLERINRGHDSANVREAIDAAKQAGLNVCGHLIFGLPGEDRDMMLTSARQAYEWGIDSVKYHPLYVVKQTALAAEYKRGDFAPITQEAYLDVLVEAIRLKPDHITIQRTTAGIEDDSLLAPAWCGTSKNVQMAAVRRALEGAGYRL
jgi:radical SAM protein (TIGR01212 family)